MLLILLMVWQRVLGTKASARKATNTRENRERSK